MSAREDFIAAALPRYREWAAEHTAGMMAPAPASPISWQARFRDLRVNWATGEVAIPQIRKPRVNWQTGEVDFPIKPALINIPFFSKAAVSALFAAATDEVLPSSMPAERH